MRGHVKKKINKSGNNWMWGYEPWTRQALNQYA